MCCNGHSKIAAESDYVDLSIVVKKLNKEVLLFVPRPNTLPEGYVPMMAMLTIAGKKVTLIVLRPGAAIKLGPMDGAKVVYGVYIHSVLLHPYNEIDMFSSQGQLRW